MNIKLRGTEKVIKKFQEGGAMPPAEEQPAAPQQQEANPLIQLAQMAVQALESQDCNMAMQICQALVEIAQQASAPEEAPGEPVFAKGGKLLRRI